MDVILAIDAGTTGVRSLLIDKAVKLLIVLIKNSLNTFLVLDG